MEVHRGILVLYRSPFKHEYGGGSGRKGQRDTGHEQERKKPAKLFETAQYPANQSVSADLLEDSSLTRFDPRTPGRNPKKRSNKKRRRFNGKKNAQ